MRSGESELRSAFRADLVWLEDQAWKVGSPAELIPKIRAIGSKYGVRP